MKTCSKCKSVKPEDEFYERSGKCKPCRRTEFREWCAKNPEKVKERVAKHSSYYRDNKAKLREYFRLRHYGLTPEGYNDLVIKQNGVCAICGKIGNRPLDVDHCHRTGAVRGLLCSNCNRALGLLRDDARAVKAMEIYLLNAGAV